MKITIVSKKHSLLVLFGLLLASIIFYIFAPLNYSHYYCLILLFLFIITSLITIRNTIFNNNYFNFHTLFLLSFFFVNFVYPVFLYPKDPFYFPVFRMRFDTQIITKATALALLGACSYNFGAVLRSRKIGLNVAQQSVNLSTIQFILTNWIYFIFILILVFAGHTILKGNFGAHSRIPPGLMVIFQISIGLSIILIMLSQRNQKNMLKFIWKFNKPVLFLLISFILLFLYVGSRGPVLQIFLILIGSFSLFIKPIKLRNLVFITFLGMLIFTFVSYARAPNASSENKGGVSNYIERGLRRIKLNSVFDLGMDLIINNRNLYVGFQYANENGFNYGKCMFYYLFAPVPYLPSLVTKVLFNEVPSNLTSARIITDESKSTYGLGSNIIADLYMAFGLSGVVIFMFLLGYLVSRLQIKAHQTNNLNAIIAYLFMVGFSIYLPRTSILDPFRHIVWAIILIIFLKNIRLALIRLTKKQVIST